MIDTYLKSKNKASLDAIRSSVVNAIPIVQGRDATAETTDEFGTVTLAQPAVGDPDYWYTCVRAAFPILPYGDVEACPESECTAVCGVWG